MFVQHRRPWASTGTRQRMTLHVILQFSFIDRIAKRL
jgi:hypothetical protein